MTPEERALKVTEQIVIKDLAGGISGAEIHGIILIAVTEAVAEERERLLSVATGTADILAEMAKEWARRGNDAAIMQGQADALRGFVEAAREAETQAAITSRGSQLWLRTI